MKITYLYHSCFMIETQKHLFIFDLYKTKCKDSEVSPENIIRKYTKCGKKIWFLVSHTHPDHFNPAIFNYSDSDVNYIISKDVKEKIEYRHILDKYENVSPIYICADEKLCFNDKENRFIHSGENDALYNIKDGFTLETLKSTDRGVAFILNADNLSVYHAGDLNEWCNETQSKAEFGDMKARYEKEIKKISGRKFDIVFLPLDYRLGDYYKAGPLFFLDNTVVSHVFPMHMWDEYSLIDDFLKLPEMHGRSCIVHHPDTIGKTWNINSIS